MPLNTVNAIFASVKFFQAIYIIFALVLSAIILDASCFQILDGNPTVEIPFEEPVDEDLSKDFEDDNEYTSHSYPLENISGGLNHNTVYQLGHFCLAREISTPPPRF